MVTEMNFVMKNDIKIFDSYKKNFFCIKFHLYGVFTSFDSPFTFLEVNGDILSQMETIGFSRGGYSLIPRICHLCPENQKALITWKDIGHGLKNPRTYELVQKQLTLCQRDPECQKLFGWRGTNSIPSQKLTRLVRAPVFDLVQKPPFHVDSVSIDPQHTLYHGIFKSM
jgi:hypothetical protein